ncbi:MAG: PilZ domain-containing protein [Cellvibrionaceae bacterium]
MTVERRRFFRINDTVGVAYRILSQDEVDSQDSGKNQQANVFGIINDYEIEISDLLVKLRGTDPLLEEVLSAINKKINGVIDHLEMENRLIQRLAHKSHEVNISACGIAFMADNQLQVGQSLSLDIVLHPSERHVFTFGRVVGVESSEDERSCYVRLNFYNMSSNAQETLIQHIVQRQGALLRDNKPVLRS